MTNKVYQVPYGTKDILPGEMKTRRGIENAIINVFDKWGYDEVKTPDFEYVDTFGAAGAKGDFRFFDRSNNLLALRNDMTAPIARLTATRLQGGENSVAADGVGVNAQRRQLGCVVGGILQGVVQRRHRQRGV